MLTLIYASPPFGFYGHCPPEQGFDSAEESSIGNYHVGVVMVVVMVPGQLSGSYSADLWN